MPPKVKVTREKIVEIALTIVRAEGEQALNARNIASMLNCSTQPVFSNFASMEELRAAVIEGAYKIFDEYTRREVESGRYPEYKATGMAYIRFVKEEKALFMLLFMRSRQEEHQAETEHFKRSVALAGGNIGLNDNKASLFHLEMWIFVHGIATMLATGYLDIEYDNVSTMISDCYQGLRTRFEGE